MSLKYDESPAINSSILKLVKNPKVLMSYLTSGQQPMADPMILGSAVDCLVTEPEEFDKRFFIGRDYNISDNVKEIIKRVYNLKKADSLEECQQEILAVARESGYHNDWKDATLINNIIKYDDYYQDLKASDNKIIISPDMDIKISNAISILEESPTFNDISQRAQKQFEIFWETPNEDSLKSKLDFIIVNDNSVEIYDLKVTERSSLDFLRDFVRNDHPIQAAMYYDAAQYIYKGYDVTMKFLLVSLEDYSFTVINPTKNILTLGKFGTGKGVYKYMGYLERIEALKYYLATWDFRYYYPIVQELNENNEIMIDYDIEKSV
jgi:hypothetical protein